MIRRVLPILVILLIALLWAFPTTQAQDMLITNLTGLAEQPFSANYSLYLPWTPWQWEAYSTDNGEPWWVDCSQVVCTNLLSTSTNLCATIRMHGVTVTSVVLTKNVLTGETLLYSGCSTDVIASIAAPSGYQPGAELGQNAWVWREWQQVTNCLDCWGLTTDEIPPPIVTLKTRLADVNDYATYQSNIEAEAEMAGGGSTDSSSGGFARSGGMMLMDDEDSCSITDEAAAFAIINIEQDTNGVAIVFESCSDHLYEVQSADDLSTQTVWTVQALMIGDDGSTSWTDTNAPAYDHRFYRVQRYTFDGDADGDGLSNIDEFNLGTDMHNPDSDGDGLPDGVDADPLTFDHTTPSFTVTYPTDGATIYP